LAFATFVNVVTGARGWLPEIGTIIIVALTTLEIRHRISNL
jgi:hypothetical protein